MSIMCIQLSLFVNPGLRVELEEVPPFCQFADIFRHETHPTHFGAATLSNRYGTTPVSIVGRRSCMTEVGSPAENMMFPLGVIKSVV